jgi:hypothetical protein
MRLGAASTLGAALLLSGGCASFRFDADIPQSLPPTVSLDAVPFHPQLAHHCGPAALTTVLEASGAAAAYDEIVERVFVPGLEGTLQVEMMAAARGFDRIPFRVGGTLEEVLAEVAAGHPVLILQNLRIRSWPAWHYAVVVGYDRAGGSIIMRSGRQREQVTPVGRWMRQWDWASRWAVVVLPPGRMPARPDRAAAFRALADFDDRGSPAARLAAWQAAARYWPDVALVPFGMGNARYQLGEFDAAVEHFHDALAIRPDYWPARLNLSALLLQTDRPCAGLAAADHPMPAEHGLYQARTSLLQRLRKACGESAPP